MRHFRLPRHHIEFALELHHMLAKDRPGENLAWSPYSVTAALHLVAAGARGRTLEEIISSVGEPSDAACLPSGTEAADDIEVANTLWVDTTLPVQESYETAVCDRTGGGVRTANFRGDVATARQAINTDVEKATHGWIRELLTPAAVSAETRAMIVNALWARLSWLHEFDPGKTRTQAFHTPLGRRNVPTMGQQEQLAYAAANGWRLVTLPSGRIEEVRGLGPETIDMVTDGDLVFDVLVPDGDMAGLDASLLGELYDRATYQLVDLRLPRFAVAYDTELRAILTTLGIGTLFTDDADLSGISSEPIKVDSVIHRAVLTVDEKGAEGAAATAMVAPIGAAPMAPPQPIEMHIDRPFIAIVRHAPTGAIYFMARVTEP